MESLSRTETYKYVLQTASEHWHQRRVVKTAEKNNNKEQNNTKTKMKHAKS